MLRKRCTRTCMQICIQMCVHTPGLLLEFESIGLCDDFVSMTRKAYSGLIRRVEHIHLQCLFDTQVEGVDGQRAVQALHEELFIRLREEESQGALD